jgi:hypothetical protein
MLQFLYSTLCSIIYLLKWHKGFRRIFEILTKEALIDVPASTINQRCAHFPLEEGKRSRMNQVTQFLDQNSRRNKLGTLGAHFQIFGLPVEGWFDNIEQILLGAEAGP